MQTVLLILGVLLAACGAAELLRRLACRVLFPRDFGYLVIPLCGSRTDAEYLIRAARFSADTVCPVLVDCGLTASAAAHTRAVCRRMDVPFLTEKEWREIPKTALQDEKRGV